MGCEVVAPRLDGTLVFPVPLLLSGPILLLSPPGGSFSLPWDNLGDSGGDK